MHIHMYTVDKIEKTRTKRQAHWQLQAHSPSSRLILSERMLSLRETHVEIERGRVREERWGLLLEPLTKPAASGLFCVGSSFIHMYVGKHTEIRHIYLYICTKMYTDVHANGASKQKSR